MSSRHEIILGVPGNRKSSYLKDVAIRAKNENDRIVIFSFTRAAVAELTSRLVSDGIDVSNTMSNEDTESIVVTTMHAFGTSVGMQCNIPPASVQTVINEACHLMTNTDVGKQWLSDNKATLLLVDEAQDLNREQFAIIHILSEVWKCRCIVVGDPSQSIYGFQGSQPHLLDELPQKLTAITGMPCDIVSRNENYRCSEAIVNVANLGLKRLATATAPCSMVAICDESNANVHNTNTSIKPRVVVAKDDAGEQQAVCDAVRSALRHRETEHPSDIVVLHRTNYGLETIARTLIAGGMDINIDFSGEDSDSQEVATKARLRRPQCIQLRTLHSSKGGTWRHVIIAGARDGVLPSRASHDFDEEQRLFYVGQTRPTTSLVVITHCNQSALTRFISPSDIKSGLWDVEIRGGGELVFAPLGDEPGALHPAQTADEPPQEKQEEKDETEKNGKEQPANVDLEQILRDTLNDTQFQALRQLSDSLAENITTYTYTVAPEMQIGWHDAADIRALQRNALNIMSHATMCDLMKMPRKFPESVGIKHILVPGMSAADIGDLCSPSPSKMAQSKLLKRHTRTATLMGADIDTYTLFLERHNFGLDSHRRWQSNWDGGFGPLGKISPAIVIAWSQLLSGKYRTTPEKEIELAIKASLRKNPIAATRTISGAGAPGHLNIAELSKRMKMAQLGVKRAVADALQQIKQAHPCHGDCDVLVCRGTPDIITLAPLVRNTGKSCIIAIDPLESQKAWLVQITQQLRNCVDELYYVLTGNTKRKARDVKMPETKRAKH